MSGGSSPSMSVPNVFVVWLWENDGKSFDLYTPEYSTQIEEAYQQQRPTLVITTKNWLIDFRANTQTNTFTQVKRKIIRILPTVDDLCNLIYKNIALSDYRYKPYWVFMDRSWENKLSVITVDRPSEYKQYRSSIINSISSIGFTPLCTACRNHSSIELIDFLIENTANIYQLCGTPSGVKNTAAHTTAYSFFIPTESFLKYDSKKADDDAKKDFKCARSIEDKIKILNLFAKRDFKFNAHNSVGETVWDLIYELEMIKCSNNLTHTYGLLTKPFNKYTIDDINHGKLTAITYPPPLPHNWVQAIDSSNGLTYYSYPPNHSQWERPH
jgi:hypothetical protein